MKTMQAVTIRWLSPFSSLAVFPNAAIRYIKKIFTLFFDATATDYGSLTAKSRFRTIRRIFKNPFFIPFGVVILVVLFVGFFAVRNLGRNSGAGGTSGKIQIKDAKAMQVLNKQFTFPLKDTAGKEVSRLRLVLENVEIKDEIIVKGKRATSVAGRTFLIANLKITNDYTQSVDINVRDYVRLIIGGSNERLAPDIHNDPVEVQALSTKYTRVGFPIDDKKQELALQIGEITGKKEMIALKLK